MALILITPPDQDVVTLDDAKAQLRITGTDQDDLIGSMISAAVNEFDPSGGGWLGRALRLQTWELRLSSFYRANCDSRADTVAARMAIELPYPPLVNIVSVKYDDQAGVERTLVEGTGFRVLNSGGLGKQSIAPLFNQFWPLARLDAESVRIKFTAGYDSDVDPDPLPATIKQAIHLAVRNIYSLGERSMFQSMKNIYGVSETRWVVSPDGSKVIRDAVENMLSPYRIW